MFDILKKMEGFKPVKIKCPYVNVPLNVSHWDYLLICWKSILLMSWKFFFLYCAITGRILLFQIPNYELKYTKKKCKKKSTFPVVKWCALTAAAAAKLHQSCPTLCNPIDGSPLGSPTPGILQARILEWVPFPSPMHKSEKWKWSHSVVPDLATPWTVAYQAPPSVEFSRQEYWSGLPFPSPGDTPNPGMKPRTPAL